MKKLDALFFWRIANSLYKKRVPIFPRIITGLIQVIYACKIPLSCIIDETVTIAYHGLGVLMVAGTEIGEGTSIGVGVKFIRKFPFKNVPKVGKYVHIGPGAVLCGPIIVGDHAIIAANAVVTKSVPADAIVAGIPAKIIGRTSQLDYDIFANEKWQDGIAEELQLPEKLKNV